MHNKVSKADASKLVGKMIYAVKKDGTVVQGKLVKISGSQLFVAARTKGKARTSAIAPLVLFDLLAIGTAPYAGLGYGLGYGGIGYPYGGFFW